jgi:hypothetical protein
MENANLSSLSHSGNSEEADATGTGADLTFGLLINRALGGSDKRRPSDKSANEVQIEMILGQAQNLAKMSQQYAETYVVKGTKELYKLLGQLYSYTLQINESPLRDNILQRMRTQLEKNHDIKTQANTPWITTVLRFILPIERQTAYQYARVLQIAFDENLTPEELPSYIKERGGITKISETKEKMEQAAAIKDHKKKKVDMLKKIFLASAYQSKARMNVPETMVINTVEEDKTEGTFEYAICANADGQERRIIRVIKISESMEAQILQKLADDGVSDDLADVQAKLDQVRAKLGITSGWGMVPGDKGFQIGGMPVAAPAIEAAD